MRQREPSRRAVLVVDRDPRRRAALSRRMTGRRFVAWAANLKEAELLLALHTPRLVLAGDLPASQFALLVNWLQRDPRLRETRLRARVSTLRADDGYRLAFALKRAAAA